MWAVIGILLLAGLAQADQWQQGAAAFARGTLLGTAVDSLGDLTLSSFRGTNLALGAAAWSGDNPLTGSRSVTDGEVNTEWRFNNESAVLGEWIKVDLGGDRGVNRVRLRPGKTDSAASDAAEYLRETATFASSLTPAWEEVRGQLPPGMVHGDFNCATNVLVAGDDIVGVVDFDLMSRHERLYDLAYGALFSVGCIGWAPDIDGRAWERVPELLEAYARCAETTFTSTETSYLPQ